MRKTVYTTLALLAVGIAASAQSLSHTVEVTNTYKREASGIEKPDQLLPLPDSVSRFNYDFDYTVRSTPYRGAYEFKPYNVLLRPSPRPSTESKLYASFGAGYGFHPEADVVWTPVASERFHLNFYGDYRAYLGHYHDVVYDGTKYFDGNGNSSSESWKDRIMHIGTNARLDWRNGTLWADFAYTGIAGKDVWASVANNGVGIDAGLKGTLNNFHYDVLAHLNYTGNAQLNEFHTVTEAVAGLPVASGDASLGLMAETLNFNDGTVKGFAGNFAVIPSYAFSVGKMNVKAGIKVAFMLRSDSSFCPTKAGVLYPDVYLRYTLLEDILVLQAAVTGGNVLNSYEETLTKNHFLGSFAFAPDVTLDRFKLMIGARGNFKERIHYNLKAGYALKENARSWGYSAAAAGYTPLVGYMSPLSTFYVGGDFGWKSDRIDIDAKLYYQYTLKPNPQTELQKNLFGPPAFTSNVEAMYRFFGGRWKAGITLDTMTERPSVNASLPGYADLGLKTSFAVNRYWGAWLKLGNILNQKVQRVPFHAEKGVWFSVGASLNI